MFQEGGHKHLQGARNKRLAEIKGKFLLGKAIMWEVSATTQTGRVPLRVKQEGGLVDYDSGAGVCSNIENLTLGSLFEAHLSTASFGERFPGND